MIVFDRVTLTYPDASRPTLRDASFTVPEGDLCVIVGRTGVGKSTLLGAVNGLVPHFTGGRLTGRVVVDGRDTRTHRPRDMAEVVGYVGQNPLAGFVTDTVEDEIAYGMEQLGVPPNNMRKRVEETLDLMGIAELRRRPLIDLSGGQQQRVAIASVLAAHPKVLVLDEPTSALDPNAASDVLAALTTLVHEVGLTVLLAEHRLERVLHQADSVVWLPGDGSAHFGTPGRVLAVSDVIPPLAALARRLGWETVPASVREARRRVHAEHLTIQDPSDREQPDTPAALTASRLTVSYGDVTAVAGVDLSLDKGTVSVLMGRNGAGKSSLLWAFAGPTPSTGELAIDGEDPRELPAPQARRIVSLVPQTATDLLYLPTVAAELQQADKEADAAPGTAREWLRKLGADYPDTSDPRDLSEGQRLALVLAIQLTAAPKVLLLDEPTRGLDYTMKSHLAGIVEDLAADGMTVLVSTHDVEFAALVGDRVLVMADGEIIADDPTRLALTASPTYAPQVAKVFAPVPVMIASEVVRR